MTQIELNPKYWSISIDGIEQCFFPIDWALNEKEARKRMEKPSIKPMGAGEIQEVQD